MFSFNENINYRIGDICLSKLICSTKNIISIKVCFLKTIIYKKKHNFQSRSRICLVKLINELKNRKIIRKYVNGYQLGKQYI